ncbi:MAG: hypothetical protein KTR31_34905 [Myxococcales bacterium]|nr:hypothetical protein [Myxococcales bacterium]
MRTLAFLIAATLGTTACGSGTVVMPAGLDDFGNVRSATWLVITTADDGIVDVDHSLVLSNDGGFCNKAKRAYPKLAELTQEFYDDYYKGFDKKKKNLDYAELAQRVCNAYQTRFGDLANATSGLFGKNTNVLQLSTVSRDGKDFDQAPREGTYVSIDDVTGTADATWSGSLSRYSDNPYAVARDALRDVDCDSVQKGDDLYEALYVDEIDVVDTIRLVGGTLQLEAKGDNGFKLELTGSALDEAEGFEASANVDRCDVSLDGYGYLPF